MSTVISAKGSWNNSNGRLAIKWNHYRGPLPKERVYLDNFKIDLIRPDNSVLNVLSIKSHHRLLLTDKRSQQPLEIKLDLISPNLDEETMLFWNVSWSRTGLGFYTPVLLITSPMCKEIVPGYQLYVRNILIDFGAPLGIGILISWVVSIIVMGVINEWHPKSKWYNCPICGYTLIGNLGNGCPECGWNRPENEGKVENKE